MARDLKYTRNIGIAAHISWIEYLNKTPTALDTPTPQRPP